MTVYLAVVLTEQLNYTEPEYFLPASPCMAIIGVFTSKNEAEKEAKEALKFFPKHSWCDVMEEDLELDVLTKHKIWKEEWMDNNREEIVLFCNMTDREVPNEEDMEFLLNFLFRHEGELDDQRMKEWAFEELEVRKCS